LSGLQRSIESVLAQDHPSIEIVISDNASSDGTEAYCRTLADADARVGYFRHEQNAGAARNFNFVVRQAKGDFVMWLADDDTLADGAVRASVEYLQSHPSVVLVGGRSLIANADGSTVEAESLTVQGGTPTQRVLAYYRTVLYNSIFYGVWRRDVLLSVLPFPGTLGGDWIAIGRATWFGDIVTIPLSVSMVREGWNTRRTMRTLPRQLGLPDWQGRVPFGVTAWNAGADVYRLARADAHSIPSSAALGLRCGVLVLRRFSPFWSARKMSWLVFNHLPAPLRDRLRRLRRRGRAAPGPAPVV
jgi:glycosyltransferase involved in cell wall biosynthesis